MPDHPAALAAVTAGDLARVANSYFAPERQYLGLHVPVVTLAGSAQAVAVAVGLASGVWIVRRAAQRRRKRVQRDGDVLQPSRSQPQAHA